MYGELLAMARITAIFDEADLEQRLLPYMVMRFLEAGTLKDRLTAGPLSLPEIDRI